MLTMKNISPFLAASPVLLLLLLVLVSGPMGVHATILKTELTTDETLSGIYDVPNNAIIRPGVCVCVVCRCVRKRGICHTPYACRVTRSDGDGGSRNTFPVFF